MSKTQQQTRGVVFWDFDGPINFNYHDLDAADPLKADHRVAYEYGCRKNFPGIEPADLRVTDSKIIDTDLCARLPQLCKIDQANTKVSYHIYITNFRALKLTLELLEQNGYTNLLASQRIHMLKKELHKLRHQDMLSACDHFGTDRNYLRTDDAREIGLEVKTGENGTDTNNTKVPIFEAAEATGHLKDIPKSRQFLVDDNEKYQQSTLDGDRQFVYVKRSNTSSYEDNHYLFEILLRTIPYAILRGDIQYSHADKETKCTMLAHLQKYSAENATMVQQWQDQIRSLFAPTTQLIALAFLRNNIARRLNILRKKRDDLKPCETVTPSEITQSKLDTINAAIAVFSEIAQEIKQAVNNPRCISAEVARIYTRQNKAAESLKRNMLKHSDVNDFVSALSEISEATTNGFYFITGRTMSSKNVAPMMNEISQHRQGSADVAEFLTKHQHTLSAQPSRRHSTGEIPTPAVVAKTHGESKQSHRTASMG